MPLYSEVTYIGPAKTRAGTNEKRGITFHNTSNPRNASARDEATYAKRRTDASAHFYVDKTEIIQALNTDLGAGHAGSGWPNEHCIAYEITGQNSWSRERWLADVAWEAMAAQVKRDCKRWNIPARWLTVAQLKAGERGFSTHDDCRKAFGGTDHTDPGPQFPKQHLIDLLGGSDMTTAADVKKIWTTDGIIQAPESSLRADPKNTHWAPASFLLSTRNHVSTILTEVRAIRAGQEALLAAFKGLNTASVIDAINSNATAGAQRDAELLEAIRGMASGGASADAIVDEIARRMGDGGV
jgi:N-acetyl-anhydromuramyl-L-alanine amidase AmpD